MRTCGSRRDRRRVLRRLGIVLAMSWIASAGCKRDDIAIGRSELQRDESLGLVASASPASNTTTPDSATGPADVVEARKIRFVDAAAQRGLTYQWPEQPRPITALNAFGSGCAAFDGDGDGWQDILLVGDPFPKLFRNRDGAEFTDVTAASGLSAVEGNWTGCAIGDYNGDGLLDILLTGYHRLALYKNLGKLQFEAATEQAGLDPLNGGHWGSSAGFMDLDGDQWLDLVVLNYVVYGPDSKQYCEYAPGVLSGCNPREEYPHDRGEIWRNTGAGRFEPVPASQAMESTHGIALVLAFLHLDDDNFTDFYIGNDGASADLLHNLGDMRFENIAQIAGVDAPEHGPAAAMGADWGDYNRDGLLDLTITDWQGSGAALFQGLGAMLFLSRAQMMGVTRNTRSRMGFGAKWVEFDNDGWPDMFFVNGHVYNNAAEISGPSSPFRQSICLLANLNGETFTDLVPSLNPDIQRSIIGRGSATVDFNNDGRMDLLAVDFEGPVMLLENRSESENHWITLELRGPAPNVFGYGARITGKAGERIWYSEVSPASSYLSSSDLRIHWGLGKADRLDTLTIRWPSGTEQTLTDVAADQFLQITAPTQPAQSTGSKPN